MWGTPRRQTSEILHLTRKVGDAQKASVPSAYTEVRYEDFFLKFPSIRDGFPGTKGEEGAGS